MRLLCLLALLWGCPGDDTGKATDRDGDGVEAAEDCDDTDGAVGRARAWFTDTDRDGYGTDASVVEACSRPEGTSATNDDCDDGDATVWPGAAERCDSLDNDCDGVVDLDDPDLDPTTILTLYTDGDGDGYGDAVTATTACAGADGQSEVPGDCDDADDGVHPGAAEVCNGTDDDCDDAVDDADPDAAGTDWYADADGDGHGDPAAIETACVAPTDHVADGDDCDDDNPWIHPGADESDCADRTDYNCDGSTGYADADYDGAAACEDCDDTDGDVFPGAPELCNAHDDDCDGAVDVDAVDAPSWYADADTDGYGDGGVVSVSCDAPAGYIADGTDCDDTTSEKSPAAVERCNGDDDDCDGTIDEDDASDATTWYADADGDGYGDAGDASPACDQPAGYVADLTDCDDADEDVNPAATEACNGLDDDCDGTVDEDDATDALAWYTDADADGYGDPATETHACAEPAGAVDNDDDCDDGDADTRPDADEVCGGADEDCDGDVDEASAVDAASWYADADADGYGAAAIATVACTAPADTTADATDCDDADAGVHPGASETCDGIDEDCDSAVDDGAVDPTDWYPDNDSDGYGDEGGTPTAACDAPLGYVADDTDCDDSAGDVNPGETETCDTVDNDCDGDKDEANCPCTTVEYAGHVYMYCTSTATWANAQTACRLYGYDLVTLETSAENSAVVSQANSTSATRWWMGYNDRTTEGTWAWSSGSGSYTNWHSGEPNNSGNEDCGELLRWSDTTWNDESCDDSLPYVCEE